ncbi:FmdB family zinc ribbon protein [Verminephrobacter eiseniae]|uniref:Putative regulatory protein, FmdB family n=1 Tax=Verminephrobacter eiseniae (strain EF01-2) TaxID=391735 RepID=A1WHI4_VEREI|nr:FmdB family zinc ribbon protein [Verminephrobacter eiseniae]ABM57091.1 putative regulatory protein, FmdB family [Verminephrobacter eiseniae EF01-2]MCW5287427.1 zinc ribbon domain-containing protein [Verminephrobacter eiseniae]MCW5305726.1 zinc ribbon domain-containing protein [Verminephrobacter eiseniae]MCW8180016.1 zinc ribbon domain-containing protein [Verminephrobacter eiseniae]MCW8188468.1 zinc ribbon domain-containing protein [Verminephrobacter eiseniae]
MPIYAYRCGSCGHAKDVLQKLSDQPLTRCPACGAEAFAKQLTAAGFQLKGSGWYVTDFRGGSSAPAKTDDAKADAKTDAKPEAAGTGTGAAAEKAAPSASTSSASSSSSSAPSN